MENVTNDLSKSEILIEFRTLARENSIRRLDDQFLQRFLVGHHWDVDRALKAICNSQSFIDRRKDTWLNLERNHVEKIINSQIIDVLEKTGQQEQKVVWIRLEKWDPDIFTADEILEVSGLLCELLYVKTNEVKHIDVIMDMHNFSLKHLYGLSKKFARRMIFFMSQCLPMNLSHIYVIRQPRIFYLGYALYKPFIEERMKKIIHISGENYECLMKNIGIDCLPSELGGTCENVKSSRWLNMMNQRKTQKDLNMSGYKIFQKPSNV